MQLSIIILNYNTRDFLKNVLESLQTKFSHEVIIVDNGSTDGSQKLVKTHFQSTKLIENKKNLGFSKGNNIGIKQAKGKYVMLLNSDTKIVGDSIDRAIQYLNKHPKVGILSPKLIFPDGAIDLACHRGFPTPTNSLLYFLNLERFFPNSKLFSQYHQTWKDFVTTHEVDAVSGAAMIIRRKVFDQIGFLDERFFMYAEDIDFCLRAKQKNWKVVYFPKSVVVHFKGVSGTKSADSKSQKQAKKHFYSTMKQYFDKHYGSKYPKPVLKGISSAIDLLSKTKIKN